MQKIGSHRDVKGEITDGSNATRRRPRSPSDMKVQDDCQTSSATFPLNDLKQRAICDDGHLISDREAANLLALSVKTIRNWRLSGYGPPHFKIGRLVRYRMTDIKTWLKTRERASTSDRGDGHA
jgi:predicted DNA-binding transcriptional regulator AlpA